MRQAARTAGRFATVRSTDLLLGPTVHRQSQVELARKLNLLLDVVVAEGNTPYPYKQTAQGRKDKGVALSRARWAYMITGKGPLVTDSALLTGIGEFFRIPPEYLLHSDGDLPDRVDAHSHL